MNRKKIHDKPKTARELFAGLTSFPPSTTPVYVITREESPTTGLTVPPAETAPTKRRKNEGVSSILRDGTALDGVKILDGPNVDLTLGEYRAALANALDRIAVLELRYDEFQSGLWKAFGEAGQYLRPELIPQPGSLRSQNPNESN